MGVRRSKRVVAFRNYSGGGDQLSQPHHFLARHGMLAQTNSIVRAGESDAQPAAGVARLGPEFRQQVLDRTGVKIVAQGMREDPVQDLAMVMVREGIFPMRMSQRATQGRLCPCVSSVSLQPAVAT